MSAKLTIVFFILICFEIGALLIRLPWLPHPSWNENYLVYTAADRLHWRWFASAMTSGYLRGAVSGLGVLNVLLGVWEIKNFKTTVRTFQVEFQGKELELATIDTAVIPDHRPANAPPGR